MAWIERLDKRARSSKLFQDSLNPAKFSLDAQVATAWHYQSDPDGAYDSEVDFTPQRILPGDLPGRWSTFNGWIVQQAGYYYGLSTSGECWFVGRRGYRGMSHTLLRVGYLRWSNRDFRPFLPVGPTWDIGQLVSELQQVLVPTSGQSLNVENVARWNDLYPALPAGQLDLTIRGHGNGMKANPEMDWAALNWLRNNRPPTYYWPGIDPTDAYFTMLFRLNVDDLIRADEPIFIYLNNILRPITDIDLDDLDGTANIELRDSLGRAIGWLPVDDAIAIDPTTGEELGRQRLRKRIFYSGGVYYLAVGIRADTLNSAMTAWPGMSLIFDPTIDVQVGASNRDANELVVGNVSIDDSVLWHSYRNTTYYGCGLYWDGITIPNGATADNGCYIEGYFDIGPGDDANCGVCFTDRGTPSVFSAGGGAGTYRIPDAQKLRA